MYSEKQREMIGRYALSHSLSATAKKFSASPTTVHRIKQDFINKAVVNSEKKPAPVPASPSVSTAIEAVAEAVTTRMDLALLEKTIEESPSFRKFAIKAALERVSAIWPS